MASFLIMLINSFDLMSAVRGLFHRIQQNIVYLAGCVMGSIGFQQSAGAEGGIHSIHQLVGEGMIPPGLWVIYDGKIYCEGIELYSIIMLIVGIISLVFLILKGFLELSNQIKRRKLIRFEESEIEELQRAGKVYREQQERAATRKKPKTRLWKRKAPSSKIPKKEK